MKQAVKVLQIDDDEINLARTPLNCGRSKQKILTAIKFTKGHG